MKSAAEISDIVEDKLSGSGIFLINVQVSATGKILVEIDRDEGVKVSDCAMLNRYLAEVLDRENNDFELQVSSPGLDKPFKVKRQYLKNIGREVEIIPVEGDPVKGKLITADDEGIRLNRKEKVKQGKKKVEVEENIDLKYTEIKEARVLIKF